MKQKIVAISNQKGGVGKTTLTREVGMYLAQTGARTAVIDADPQGNLSKSLVSTVPPGLYESLTGTPCDLLEVKRNFFLCASSINLAGLEKTLIGEIDAYIRIKTLLNHEIFSPFKYILIDCPPSLGLLTVNALTAADHLVIAMSPALYTMQGTNDLLETITKVKQNLNPDLLLLGVIINAFDSIPVITRQIRKEIEDSFGSYVFSQSLSKSIKIEEAIAEQEGIIQLKKGKVKDEIILIGKEFVKRLEAAS